MAFVSFSFFQMGPVDIHGGGVEVKSSSPYINLRSIIGDGKNETTPTSVIYYLALFF